MDGLGVFQAVCVPHFCLQIRDTYMFIWCVYIYIYIYTYICTYGPPLRVSSRASRPSPPVRIMNRWYIWCIYRYIYICIYIYTYT